MMYNILTSNNQSPATLTALQRTIQHDGVITMSDHDTTTNPPLKRCSKCGLVKPWTIEFFRSDKSKSFGLRSKCADCDRAYDKARQSTPKRKAYDRQRNS